MVMFGYFSWNCALSVDICFSWPPRTSWSQTVRVTSPSEAASVFTDDGAGADDDDGVGAAGRAGGQDEARHRAR